MFKLIAKLKWHLTSSNDRVKYEYAKMDGITKVGICRRRGGNQKHIWGNKSILQEKRSCMSVNRREILMDIIEDEEEQV